MNTYSNVDNSFMFWCSFVHLRFNLHVYQQKEIQYFQKFCHKITDKFDHIVNFNVHNSFSIE